MGNSLVIGQYVPGDSLIHRLDPRTKMIMIAIFVVVVFFANNYINYSLLVVFAFFSMSLSTVPLRYVLKGLTPVWFLIIFTFLLHLFITSEGEALFSIFGLTIYSGGIIQGIFISIRFFLLIFVTSLLTLTTTPIKITDAIESMLHPLKKIKFPVHELALMMSISLRFIPTLMQETDKISKAQAARGVDFKTGPIRERAKAIVPLLIPLFVSAFKRAEELAMAMEARGYRGGEGRTKLRELSLQKRDVISFIVFIIVVGIVFYTRQF